jgi:hypothetical protein
MRRAQLGNDLGQRLPFDELHGIVVHAPLTAHRIDRHDVLVVQMRRGLRFVLESLELFGVHRRGKRQHFQRDPAAQGHLLRFVNHSHAATADLTHNVEIPQRRPRLEIRGGRRGAGHLREQR